MERPLTTTLVFVRHAESEARARNLVQGVGLAVPLTEEGTRQAERAAAALSSRRFDRIYASAARRAIDTAAAIRRFHPDAPYAELPALNERSKGEAEGMDKDAFAARYPEIIAAWAREEDPRVPGGESLDDVRARVMPVLHAHVREAAPGATLLYVTHGNLIRAALGEMLGIPSRLVSRIEQGYCAMSVAAVDPASGRWHVACVNQLPSP